MDIPSLVAQIASSLGVPTALAVAQAQAESDFDPNAVSSEGAVGVMQLMPATAAGLGVTNLTDPTQNITGGLTYDLQMLSMFGGDWQAALAAYNWGPGNVQKAQAAYGSDWFSHAPSVTQAYVTKILGAEVAADGSDSGSPPDATDSGASTVLPVVAIAAIALIFLS
jgi:soluble lytic murein transglycosylase-like protein